MRLGEILTNTRRAYRWFLFLAAILCFFYVLFIEASAQAVALFFVTGGLWYWREQKKARELDAPRPK